MAFIKLLTKVAKAASKKAGSRKNKKKAQIAKTQNRILKTVKAVAEDKKLVPKGLTGEAKKKYLANLKKKKQSSVPKKADKKIEGSGSHSARPIGSKGKTKIQDSPRGSVAGASMKDTKKTHARKVADVKGTTKDGIPREMEAEYNATSKGHLRTMWAAIMSKDPVKKRKAFSGSKLTPAMFVRIYLKRVV